MLYNFRGGATLQHQQWLVRVGVTFAMEAPSIKCLVAHDSRPASRKVALALMQVAASTVASLVYVGQWSTPAIAFACRRQHWQAVVITASHNAWDQIGLKLFDEQGLPLSPMAEDALALRTSMVSDPPFLLTAPVLLPASLSVLQDYIQLLADGVSPQIEEDTVVEVGAAWRTPVAQWLPGMKIRGATRTDPSAEPPSHSIQGDIFRVDEDLDKLVVWKQGKEIPGQMLLMQWMLQRPVGIVCLSFDVTRFTQWSLEQCGYTVVTTPVGDQFVAHAMAEQHALTGGEPNGHFIAAERSFCPDALASMLDLLKPPGETFLLWQTPAASYYRGILAPFPYTFEEMSERLTKTVALAPFPCSFPPHTMSLVAEREDQRVIVRLSRFEEVVVLQTEGRDARDLFTLLAACFPASSIQRREYWTE